MQRDWGSRGGREEGGREEGGRDREKERERGVERQEGRERGVSIDAREGKILRGSSIIQEAQHNHYFRETSTTA